MWTRPLLASKAKALLVHIAVSVVVFAAALLALRKTDGNVAGTVYANIRIQ